MRYGIEHPVVNDRDFKVWGQFAGRAWPTLFFIDPQGRIIGKHEGEITFAQLDGVVSQMIDEFERKGLLVHQPLPPAWRRAWNASRRCSFRGRCSPPTASTSPTPATTDSDYRS